MKIGTIIVMILLRKVIFDIGHFVYCMHYLFILNWKRVGLFTFNLI